ncbi:MAG: tRNA uridine-5-carboxymethylaminomethyl(34) synthesis enzyme MnmG, partial [Defluviitaleaceae bacterium]|nr:tRNA uridine-5-carboxymethylaminomethyl(34) synthesis enzyme MnmG [Defluviitaleaceae bacterium]
MKTIVVIGGGHAGCEAALAAARIGAKVILFALSLDSIAHLPCNPCIGGSAKGHLVREIDALGGEMARAIDATFIQSRMLNTAKGPAVYSLRAQTDKKNYMTYMKKILENEKNIFLREGEIVEILTTEVLGGFTPGSVLPSASLLSEPLQTFYKKFDKNFNTETRSRVSDESFEGVRGNFSKSFPEKKNKNSPEKKIVSVKTANNEIIPCDAAIVCTGTYLNARCLHGETIAHTGPGGLKNARGLSDCLEKLGFALQRFKTGTPARIHKRSVDFSKMSAQHGDEKIVPFSFETDPREIFREQIPCHLTYTTPATHEIIRASLHRSAMYSGLIEATGTRYCPSIE